jgi:hypothetical protein
MASPHWRPFARGLLLALLLGLARPAAAAPRPRLAFLGLTPQAGMPAPVVASVSEYVQTELADLGAYEVIGLGDIDSLLGLERKKQLLGCDDDTSCLTEIGGALGVDRALTGTLSRVGDSVLVNLTLLDVPAARVVGRVGRRVVTDGALDHVLDAIGPLLEELAAKDGRVTSAWHVEVVVRGEADVPNNGRAIAASAILQGAFGGAVLSVAGPPAGLRLEGRLAPVRLGVLRPFLTAGGAIFPDTKALRGSAGLAVELDHLRVLADVAWEHYFAEGLADAVLLGVGAGYAF